MKVTIPPELTGEYIIRVVDNMPDGSKGCVIYDEEGFANVYINAALSNVGQHDAADHEMIHIINDDINNDDDIRVVEARADGKKRKENVLSTLMKAKDLMPMPEKKENVKANVPYTLTRRQLKVVLQTIHTLDRFLALDLGDT